MATNGEVQNPPILDDYTNYDNWLKDLDVWKMFTSTAKTKQGPRLYLSLKGKARELVRELDLNAIGAENGVNVIVEKLNDHFQKDKVQQSYIHLENFENFRRSKDVSIKDYITEFEKLNSKIKLNEMTLPDGVLAYKLLHHANLSGAELNLIKATMSELSYQEIKEKMQKIFNDITSKPSVKSESSIKVEGNLYDNESKDAYSTMLTIVIDLEIGDFKETTEVEVGTSAGVKL